MPHSAPVKRSRQRADELTTSATSRNKDQSRESCTHRIPKEWWAQHLSPLPLQFQPQADGIHPTVQTRGKDTQIFGKALVTACKSSCASLGYGQGKSSAFFLYLQNVRE